MKEELGLEDLPAPGEPLQASTHSENRALLDDDVAYRVEQMSRKLGKRQYRRLENRYRWLWKQLNRAGYNYLVRRRWEAQQECQRLLGLLKNPKMAKHYGAIRERGVRVAAYGRKVVEQLGALQSLVGEFDFIRRTLNAHDEVVEWEAEQAENNKAFRRESRVYEKLIVAVCQQSPRLHHKGTDKRGRDFIRIPRIEHVQIKDDRIYYQIQLSSQNVILRLLGKYRSALPYGVDVRNLSQDETLENLAGATKRKVTFERGKRGETVYWVVSRLDSPDGLPDRVLFSKVFPFYPVEQHEKTPWPAGVTGDRIVKYFNFEDEPHALIAGATKGGKSNLINVIIATLVHMNSPEELRLVLIDNKGGVEFTHWREARHLLMPMIKRPDEVVPALKQVHGMLTRRLAQFEAMRAKSLADFNRRVKPDDKLSRIVVIVDEMATLQGDTAVQAELRDLTSQGRAVGIHILLCTQHVVKEVVDTTIKVNMVLRIAAQMPTQNASLTILDTSTAALLPKIAGRMVFKSGMNEYIIQTPFISDDEVGLAVAKSKEWPMPDSAELHAEEAHTPRERFGRADLLDVVFGQLEGKLSPTRIHAIVGNELATERQVRAMVKSIIDAEEIEHGDMRYRVRKVGKSHVLELMDDETQEAA